MRGANREPGARLRIRAPQAHGSKRHQYRRRLVEATGKYKRACRLALDAPQRDETGTEVLPYIQVCNTPGQVGMNLQATISRLPSNPTTIVAAVWYFRYEAAGQFKASSYNAAGESPLSPTTVSF